MAKKIKHQTTRALTGWAFISPWVIGFLLFTLFPILMSLFLSFNDVVYGAEGIMLEFVGFKNYMNAFSKNMECLEAIVVFLKDSIFMVFIINVFAVLFAVLLNTNIKGRGFFTLHSSFFTYSRLHRPCRTPHLCSSLGPFKLLDRPLPSWRD